MGSHYNSRLLKFARFDAGISLLAGAGGALGGALLSLPGTSKDYDDLKETAEFYGIPEDSEEYKQAVKDIRKEHVKNALRNALFSGLASAGMTTVVNLRR